jgi:hypothetical protein
MAEPRLCCVSAGKRSSGSRRTPIRAYAGPRFPDWGRFSMMLGGRRRCCGDGWLGGVGLACGAAQTAPVQGVPPQIAAAFSDLDRLGRVHAPTTGLLRTFHKALAARVPERGAARRAVSHSHLAPATSPHSSPNQLTAATRARAGSFWRASVGCGSPGLARGIAQVPMDGILLPVHNGAECEHWHRSTGAGVVWV